VKRFYYREMANLLEYMGWQLFIFEPYGTNHGKIFAASDRYKRKLAMLNHPSNG
jgi:hypothetical protein